MTNKNKSINYYYIINFNLNYMNYFEQQKQNRIKKENQEKIGVIAFILTAIFFAISFLNLASIDYDVAIFNLPLFATTLILCFVSGFISLYFLNK